MWTKGNNRVRAESWILEKVLKICPAIFQTGKRLENGDKVAGNGKKSWGVLFSKLQQVLYKWNIFLFGQILFNLAQVTFQCIMKRALFLRFLRSLLLPYLITLVWRKKLLFWKKSMEQGLSYGSKNLYEPCNKRHLRQAMVGNKDQQYYFSILGANLSSWRIQQCRFHWIWTDIC